MSTVFAVMAADWDYNDEYYYTTEGGGGHPKRVFRSKEKADNMAKELTAQTLRRVNLRDYSEAGMEGILGYNNLATNLEQLEAAGIDPKDVCDENHSESKLDDYTDAQLLVLADLICIPFYEVVEVEIDED
jgi:hypothetical protein